MASTVPGRYGYFGPAGTFTQMALLAWAPANPGGDGVEHVSFASPAATLAAVRSGEIDVGMVPIENSVEGGVTATLDNLAVGDPLVIVGEVVVPVTFVVAARPGTELAEITAVGTHSHAWAQVRGWMANHLPEVAYVPTLSTAASAIALDPMNGQDALFQACVCAPVAAANAGLEVLADDVGDNHSAVTRFVAVARPGAVPAPTGRDKTTVVLYQKTDRAGGLLELLEQFAVRGVNMTRLESRPTGESMGSYCFSIDIEGHVADARIADALMGLKRVCADVVYLGSYPRADEGRPSIAPGMSDDDFASARDWLRVVRGY